MMEYPAIFGKFPLINNSIPVTVFGTFVIVWAVKKKSLFGISTEFTLTPNAHVAMTSFAYRVKRSFISWSIHLPVSVSFLSVCTISSLQSAINSNLLPVNAGLSVALICRHLSPYIIKIERSKGNDYYNKWQNRPPYILTRLLPSILSAFSVMIARRFSKKSKYLTQHNLTMDGSRTTYIGNRKSNIPNTLKHSNRF